MDRPIATLVHTRVSASWHWSTVPDGKPASSAWKAEVLASERTVQDIVGSYVLEIQRDDPIWHLVEKREQFIY